MLDLRIGAATQRFAVLGESLPHTWSPAIHNSLFQQAGRDAVYLPVTVPMEKLPSAVDVLRSCFAGFNVTIPYKERIMPLLDGVDAAARVCGAVNTVENCGGKLIGHITDGLGMLTALRLAGVATDHVRVLILGGGGAARVAGNEFLSRAGEVTFAARDAGKGVRLAGELAETQDDGMARIRVCTLDSVPSGAYDILVNCTPVGMYPRVGESPVEREVVSRCAAVFDAVYNPRRTRLIELGAQLGLPCVEGLGMLFYQAVEAQKLWFSGETGVAQSAQEAIYAELLARMK